MTDPDDISTEVEDLQARLVEARRAVTLVSHEVRGQLAGILGLAQVALQSDSADEHVEYLSQIRSTGEAMLTLVNDILDISRVEAGQMRIDHIPFSLGDCVRNAAATLTPAATTKGLQLRVDIDEAVPDRVTGDPGRIRQILVNLISNAIKFTDAGTIDVHVIAAPGATESLVEFSVIDTGRGVPTDMRTEIFEPFTQVHPSTVGQMGSGLGLTICRQLVDLMGGDIWMEPRAGGGSAFRFTAELPAHDQPHPGHYRTTRRIEGSDIIVVAEGPAGGRRLVDAMRSEGITGIDTVALSEVAGLIDRRWWSASPVGVVIFDVGDHFRPQVIGLRAQPAAHSFHIAVLTSGGRRGDGEFCRLHRVGAYLTHPLTNSEVCAAIRAVLDGPPPDRLEFPVTKHWLRENRII